MEEFNEGLVFQHEGYLVYAMPSLDETTKKEVKAWLKLLEKSNNHITYIAYPVLKYLVVDYLITLGEPGVEEVYGTREDIFREGTQVRTQELS